MAGPAPFVGKITQKAILFGPDGRVLLTRVDGHWELPGGTFEYGETLVYRCVTDDTAVSLNEERDGYEWVSPETAADRLSVMGGRLSRAVERARRGAE